MQMNHLLTGLLFTIIHVTSSMHLFDTGHDILAEVYEQTIFRVACDEGFLDMLKALRRSGKQFDSQTVFDGLLAAARLGHADVVEYLIEGLAVDPVTGNNFALDLAAENGRVPVVQVLCKYDQVLSSKSAIDILENALKQGRYSVSSILWEPIQNFHKIDVDKLHSILQHVCACGYTKTAALIRNHPHIVPSFDNNCALSAACANGHFEIVKLLLKDQGVLSLHCTKMAAAACAKGHLDIFKLMFYSKALLGFSKEFPDEFKMNFLLIQNVRNAPARGLKIFTESFKVQQTSDIAVLDWALMYYCLRGDRNMLSELLKYADGIFARHEFSLYELGLIYRACTTWMIVGERAELLPLEIIRQVGSLMVVPLMEKYKI